MSVETIWWVGPLGAMLSLPDVATSPDNSIERIGAVHTSLDGTRTVDTFGYKRSYSWKWSMLHPVHVSVVEAIYTGIMPGPLRLIDPNRPNRLPIQIAAGGSVTASTRGFTTDDPLNRAVIYASPAAGGNVDNLGPGKLLRGAVTTVAEESGAVILPDLAVYPVAKIPQLPEETIEVSMWVAGTCPFATAAWLPYSRGGDLMPPETPAVPAAAPTSLRSGDPVALTPGTWTRVAASVPPGAAAIVPALTATGAGQVWTTAWQVQRISTPVSAREGQLWVCDDLLVDPIDGWNTGGGAPRVVAANATSAFPIPGLADVALTLVEV